jgi:chromosomal replication initiator protein
MIGDIQRAVAESFGIPSAEMKSSSRAREVARPRQVAMYLSKQLTPKSLPDIGRRFGGRDHTTVIHAVKQIERLRAADSELDADIRLLTRQLEG